MKGNHYRSVAMQCSTCGGIDFESEGEGSPARCVGCNRVYSCEELVRENSERIEAEVEGMKAQSVAGIRKDLSKVFKKFK